MMEKKIKEIQESGTFQHILEKLNKNPEDFTAHDYQTSKAYLKMLTPLHIFNDMVDLIAFQSPEVAELIGVLNKIKIFHLRKEKSKTITVDGCVYNREQIQKKF
jgi:hypothetical protein